MEDGKRYGGFVSISHLLMLSQEFYVCFHYGYLYTGKCHECSVSLFQGKFWQCSDQLEIKDID